MTLKLYKKITYRVNSLRTMASCLLFLLPFTGIFGETPVRVGCDRDYPPFSVSAVNGVTGFDMDFIHLLAPIAGLTPEFVPSSWATVLQSLEEEQLEIVTAIIYTEQRNEQFDFTIPYVTDYYTLFSRKDSGVTVPEDTDGRILAILRDDAALERFIVPGGLDKHLILTETYTEAISLVHQGAADYTIAPFSLGTRIINELDVPEIRATGRNLFPVSYRLAVKKGNHELLFRLNEGIAELSRNGVLHDLRKKWFPGTFLPTPANHPARQLFARVLVYLLGGLILVFFSFLTGRLASTRQLRKIRGGRDSLQEVLDAAPVGLRWHNLATGIFSENRFWRESCDRMKQYHVDETNNTEVQHFTGADGEEYWVRFRKKTFVSETARIPLTLFVMEDITDVRMLEDTIAHLAHERTRETARLLIENIADPETGLFSADFLGSRLRVLISENGSNGSSFTVLSFLFSPDECGQDRKKTAATLVRAAIRRIDYPGCTVSGRLVVLLPDSDEQTAQGIAKRIIESFSAADIEYPSNEYRVLSYPGTDTTSLLQSIES